MGQADLSKAILLVYETHVPTNITLSIKIIDIEKHTQNTCFPGPICICNAPCNVYSHAFCIHGKSFQRSLETLGRNII